MSNEEQAATPPTPKRGSFLGDVLKLVGGATLAQTVSVLVVPLLAYLYTPAAFGTAAVFTSLVFIVSTIACLRYELAIMLPDADEDAANIFAVAVSAALLVAGLSALVVLVAGRPIAQVLNAPELAPYLWLLPFALLAAGLFQALNYWNSRTRHFGRLSIARVSAVVTSKGGQATMGLTGHATVGALIGSEVAGSAVIAATLGGQVWRDHGRLFRAQVRWQRMLVNLKRYRKFPLVESWGILVNRVSLQLPVLMLAFFFSQTIVGYYTLVYRLIQLPMSLVGISLVQVFFQRTSRLRDNPTEFANVAEITFRGLVSLGLGPTLIITLYGRDLLTMVLGQKWVESGIYLQILAPWMFVVFISSPLSVIFMVAERQELLLVFHILILVSRVIALAIGGLLQDVYLTLFVFSLSGVITYGGLACWNMVLAGVSLRTTATILLQYSFSALLAGSLLLVITNLTHAQSVALLVLSVGTVLLYYLAVLRWDGVLRERLVTTLGTRLPAWARGVPGSRDA